MYATSKETVRGVLLILKGLIYDEIKSENIRV